MLSIVTWRSAVLVSAICPSCSVSSHSARLCALAVCCNIARRPSLLHLPHVFVDRSCHAHVLKEHTRQQQRATTSERRGECVARHRSPPSLSSPAERHRHTGRQAASQASKQASMHAGGRPSPSFVGARLLTFFDRPPASCVVSVTSTRLYTLNHSGWWSVFSASSATRDMNPHASLQRRRRRASERASRRQKDSRRRQLRSVGWWSAVCQQCRHMRARGGWAAALPEIAKDALLEDRVAIIVRLPEVRR